MISVYSKPGCMPCKLTKEALEREGISYTTHLLRESDADFFGEVLGHKTAPVVIRSSCWEYSYEELGPGAILDHWSGFRPDKVKELARYADGDSQ